MLLTAARHGALRRTSARYRSPQQTQLVGTTGGDFLLRKAFRLDGLRIHWRVEACRSWALW
jgi:hypothetical protein